MGKDVKGQGRAGRLVNGPNGLAKEADTVENGFGTLAEKVEVLAPAGSFDSLRAAVAAGADAVYAGGRRFGARAFAQNFSRDELLEAIDYSHLHGCRFYLTVNTLLKNDEIRELPGYLNPLYEHGLDAVIVQDVGVLGVVRECFPGLDIHTSTQMTITGVHGARFLKQAGAVRVVPARELSLEEIRRLKERTGMEVECFVHGALCYCYSGQCLMSSMIGGRSGNRGQCAQPCRLFYQAGTRGGHLLSMKDICTLDLIPRLVGAGIDSFKIEGRMKRPEYVAGVTAAYRKYVDLYLERGKDGFHVEAEDKERLLDLFNRGGFHKGYYMQKNGRDMISLERPGHAGVAAVKVLSQNGRELKGIAMTRIFAGDVLDFSDEKNSPGAAGRKGGAPANTDKEDSWKYTCGFSARKGDRVTLLAPKGKKITVGRVLYRTRNQKLLDEIQETYVFGKKQEKVYGILNLSAGKPATLEISCGETRIQAHTALDVEMATGRPLEEAHVRRQMYKTKDTEFVFGRLDIVMDGELFLPMQQFNELRRNALRILEEQIQESYRRKTIQTARPGDGDEAVLAGAGAPSRSKVLAAGGAPGQKTGQTSGIRGNKVSALVETVEQLKVVLKCSRVERIYLDFDLFAEKWESLQMSCRRPSFGGEAGGSEDKSHAAPVERTRPQIYVALPFVVRSQALRRMEELHDLLAGGLVDGVLARNYESVSFLQERGYAKEIVLDYPLYVMNSQGLEFWRRQGFDAFTLSPELNHHELAEFRGGRHELVVYGRYPVMLSAQCVKKNMGRCDRAGGFVSLTDRHKDQFPVKTCCQDCHTVIYNTKPLYLYDLKEELGKIAPEWIRFQFTVEDGAQTAKILDPCGQFEGEYTRGHFYRGVT